MGRSAIRELIMGKIPNIIGRDTRYPTIALQSLSEYVEERSVSNACATTLKEMLNSEPETDGAGYYSMSKRLMQELDIINENEEAITSRTVPMMFAFLYS